MTAFISLIIVLHAILSFKKPLWGLCALLAIKILIPDNARNPFIDISLNTTCSLVLFAAWVVNAFGKKYLLDGLRNVMFRYLLFFIVFSVAIMFVTPYVPITAQVSPLFAFIVLQICPVIVAMSVIRGREDLEKVVKTFLVSALVCVVYSLVCFILKIPYPYNELFNSQFGGRDNNLENVIAQVMGDVMGRCMGTATSGTYDYGMVIAIVFTTVGAIYYKTRSKVSLVVFILCGLDVLCTTRRSPLITAMVFLAVMFFADSRNRARNLKYALIGLVVAISCVYIFPQLRSFRNIIETSLFFWDDSVAARNNVSGSSVSFRAFQFEHTLRYIQDSPFFGNGWGSPFYKSRFPEMIGWESIVFTTLMQFGYVGAIVWALLFYRFYKYSAMHKDKVIGAAFIISAVVMCILTDTIYHFFIFFGAVLIHKMSVYYVPIEDAKPLRLV